MSEYKNNTEALSQYLQSMVKLEELQKMTEDLDKELEDSQRLMLEIKSIFSNIPNGENRAPLNVELRREQLAQFLAADGPRLLMPDMVEEVNVDIEAELTGLKKEAEELKKNIAAPPENQYERSDRRNENLNLEQYAASLDEFSKRLASIKLNKANGSNRNTVLEMKLAQLCEDVNNLTQVVQTKTKLAKANNKGMANQLDNSTAMLYDNLINKLISSVNETTYLLQNRT
ncbi:uncharacterized protein LOC123864884 [Maniola jurtina]|uniref:uncharacterized protein LOC123864884 n=1 Tax=Maniola jurtina TaxID=191418 RepID=UPI001E6866AA|nr:uncharacterized protein LOC123864884 [Maniola jurtina]XP_045761567.1 uncharacterized protein LOC123864884 [Maniola jurtina]